jgi:hypothetical protein
MHSASCTPVRLQRSETYYHLLLKSVVVQLSSSNSKHKQRQRSIPSQTVWRPQLSLFSEEGVVAWAAPCARILPRACRHPPPASLPQGLGLQEDCRVGHHAVGGLDALVAPGGEVAGGGEIGVHDAAPGGAVGRGREVGGDVKRMGIESGVEAAKARPRPAWERAGSFCVFNLSIRKGACV